jgi:hypothetical protein
MMELRRKVQNLPVTAYFPQTLPWALMMFRSQQCTDPRDKIYSLLGLATSDYDIDVNYARTTQVYILSQRKLVNTILAPLSWVEMNDRDPAKEETDQNDGIPGLPSWITDWTQVPSLAISLMSLISGSFSADEGFPLVEREPWMDSPDSPCGLTLRGLCIAVITGTILSAPVSGDAKLEKENLILLIRDDTDLSLRDNEAILFNPSNEWRPLAPGTEMAPKLSCYNTTWAPRFCGIGDNIIVSPGSKVPLVLRRMNRVDEEGSQVVGYLFLGFCWMIDGQIEDINDLATDPTMSRLMFGRACQGLLESYKAEILRVY